MSNAVITKESSEQKINHQLIPKAQVDEIIAIDETTQAFQRAIIEAEEQGNLTFKALLIARATRTLQQLLKPALMDDIMSLQGSPLGFRTDRDKAKEGPREYPVEIVRDVVIQALIRGFQVTGNQINIIAGNLYVTKEGFENRLNNFEGLTDLQIDMEVPDVTSRKDSALVACVARWRFNGKLGELACAKTPTGDYRIPIRVNAGQGDDAILGKAKSKLFRKVFERLSGMSVAALDADGAIDADEVTNISQAESTAKIESQASAEPSAPASPEYLDQQSESDLTLALEAIRNRNQFDAAKTHWRAKAKNREFTPGQMLTIGNKFNAREQQGFA